MVNNNTIARSVAVHILETLRIAGYTAYLAGGCVRDQILGIEPKDYDIATSAVPKQVRKLFPNSRYVGAAFGVVLVYQNKVSVEVATFRSESGYEDGRHPNRVVFTDSKNDALRRDFTINGLFGDPLNKDTKTGRDFIIDYVGGQEDIQKGLVRAIGDAQKRFDEDYLRMLRAPRFAAELNFKIEKNTANAIKNSAANLTLISKERIGQEIKIMLTGKNPACAAVLIQTLLLDEPALNQKHVDCRCLILEELGSNIPCALALAAWMIDRQALDKNLETIAWFCENKARSIITRWRKALVLSNQEYEDFIQIIKIIAKVYNWQEMDKAGRKRLLAKPMWNNGFRLLQRIANDTWINILKEDTKLLFSEGVQPTPFVDGKDLIALGARPGPRFSVLLKEAYNMQLSGQVLTSKQMLKWLKQRLKTTD